MYDPKDQVNQFHSKPKGFGSVVKADTPKVGEWQEQLKFCKWLKHTYPDVLFRSDIQAGTKKSPQMQNIIQIVDPYSGWPDIMVYLKNPIAIEMKSITASLSGEHYRKQCEMHNRLRKLGWRVVVCKGADEAKKVFMEYMGAIQLPERDKSLPYLGDL